VLSAALLSAALLATALLATALLATALLATRAGPFLAARAAQHPAARTVLFAGARDAAVLSGRAGPVVVAVAAAGDVGGAVDHGRVVPRDHDRVLTSSGIAGLAEHEPLHDLHVDQTFRRTVTTLPRMTASSPGMTS
jgi:hypothetical protein